MIAFVGMETSGMTRRALLAQGVDAYSCDLLPAQDVTDRHFVGDVFEVLDGLYGTGRWPVLGVFHPDCTYLTNSAAWAFNEPDYVRYPGVGYHQRVKPGTLVGKARHAARREAVDLVYRIRALKMRVKVIENPIGHLSQKLGRPTQIVQPYLFGDDASKATCLWVYEDGELLTPREWLPIISSKRCTGRLVKGVERWGNQTDSGQNSLSPGDDRWARRSDTYPGIATALAKRLARYEYGVFG